MVWIKCERRSSTLDETMCNPKFWHGSHEADTFGSNSNES